ncbi:Septum formation [Parafrankia irregularis]|uniref:Septum formation n=2 Tax=Frankiaceae TaxID=74712 RepID=A0A0S4QJT8_9ACTN|nr:Septum formation [Parafrankia irregularis]
MTPEALAGVTVTHMAPRHPDPFEGVRLDERFVRSARFLEPSAMERAGRFPPASGARCTVVPAPRGLHGLVFRLFVAPPRPAPRARRLTWVLAVLTLALGMISLTFIALRQTARSVPVATLPQPALGISTTSSTLASHEAGGQVATTATRFATGPSSLAGNGAAAGLAAAASQGFDLTPALFAGLRAGDCLAWPAAPATRLAPVPVDCSQPHIDEITKVVDRAGGDASWPGADVLSASATDLCGGSLLASAGAFGVASSGVVATVWPDRASWEGGVHGLACTIRSQDLTPRSGRLVIPAPVQG